MSAKRARAAAAAALLLVAALPAGPVGAMVEETDRPPVSDNGIRLPGAGAAGPAEGRGPAVPTPDDSEVAPPAAVPAAGDMPAGESGGTVPEETIEETPAAAIADPLEPVNRAVFTFNDKAYFWVMKPIARGYGAIVPQGARVSVRNFFSNLATPVRFANNLLQGKLKGAGTELVRFVVNSTIGIGGLFDPARTRFDIRKRDEDLGQTLGRYGLGQGLYIVWPILGPSSARDTVGLVGDYFADPLSYIGDPAVEAGVRAGKTENEISLSIGDYEDLKKSTLDPYVAVRDAYIQNRARKVAE